MRRGLATVVPLALLSLMSWRQMEHRVCGEADVDVEFLKSMTTYEECSENSPHVQLFWRMMRERLGPRDRQLFLRFVWGRSRLPRNRAEAAVLGRQFTICSMHGDALSVDRMLPTSATWSVLLLCSAFLL